MLYNNVTSRSWGPSSEVSTTILSIRWDFNGVIFYEILPPEVTIYSTIYCSLLFRSFDRTAQNWQIGGALQSTTKSDLS